MHYSISNVAPLLSTVGTARVMVINHWLECATAERTLLSQLALQGSMSVVSVHVALSGLVVAHVTTLLCYVG